MDDEMRYSHDYGNQHVASAGETRISHAAHFSHPLRNRQTSFPSNFDQISSLEHMGFVWTCDKLLFQVYHRINQIFHRNGCNVMIYEWFYRHSFILQKTNPNQIILDDLWVIGERLLLFLLGFSISKEPNHVLKTTDKNSQPLRTNRLRQATGTRKFLAQMTANMVALNGDL